MYFGEYIKEFDYTETIESTILMKMHRTMP